MLADLPLFLVLVAAFAAAIFLAAAETALLRIGGERAHTLGEAGDRAGRRVARLTAELPRVLNTILLTALLAQIVAATVTGILANRRFGSAGVTIASVVLTVVLFIYAEAIPKTFAVQHADRTALAVSGPVTVLDFVLRPLVSALVRIADLQAPGKGIATSPTVTEAELRRLALRAAAEGEIEAADRELIERAFRFGDRRTDDVMVPRTDIVGVSSEATVEQALTLALETGHRRIVVYEGTVDHITGVARLRDLVAVPAERRGLEVAIFATDPLVVPESKRIVPLLRQMQAGGTHLAVVVDEYGGTAGLVTVEDIAEELLGSIAADAGGQDLVRIDDRSWAVAGLLPVEDLESALGVDFGDGDWNTAAGLVVARLGRLPRLGDEVDVAGQRFRVTAVRGRRIHRLEVQQPAEGGGR